MGITVEQARDQKAGSFIGYLNLIGPKDGLSDAQYEGAQDYLRLREAYKRSMGSADAMYDPEATSVGVDPDAYAQWCVTTRKKYDDARKAIQEEQNCHRENLWAALQYVVIDGQHLHSMIGATRVLCNVLALYFKTGVDNCKAA